MKTKKVPAKKVARKSIKKQPVGMQYPVTENWKPQTGRGLVVDYGLERLLPGQAIIVPSSDPGSSKFREAVRVFTKKNKHKAVTFHSAKDPKTGKRSYVAWCQK